MAKYLIHACNQRMWYVNNYLLPSMYQQGIDKNDITVWNDAESKGTLKSCIESFEAISNNPGGTWHLQDDVLISSLFKEITEAEDRGIRCGFCSRYDKDATTGIVYGAKMWYSFPCIRIPNTLAEQFTKWLERNKMRLEGFISANKYADNLFHMFIEEKHPTLRVVNLSPNIVEHVDYLIGGSVTNPQRDNPIVTSKYWNEPYLVQKLEKALN